MKGGDEQNTLRLDYQAQFCDILQMKRPMPTYISLQHRFMLNPECDNPTTVNDWIMARKHL